MLAGPTSLVLFSSVSRAEQARDWMFTVPTPGTYLNTDIMFSGVQACVEQRIPIYGRLNELDLKVNALTARATKAAVTVHSTGALGACATLFGVSGKVNGVHASQVYGDHNLEWPVTLQLAYRVVWELSGPNSEPADR
jgi:hypothetical protein